MHHSIHNMFAHMPYWKSYLSEKENVNVKAQRGDLNPVGHHLSSLLPAELLKALSLSLSMQACIASFWDVTDFKGLSNFNHQEQKHKSPTFWDFTCSVDAATSCTRSKESKKTARHLLRSAIMPSILFLSPPKANPEKVSTGLTETAKVWNTLDLMMSPHSSPRES